MTKENNKDIGYAKDNNGELVKAYPMKAMGDFVILENQLKANISEGKEKIVAGIKRKEKTEEDPLMLGRWTVVAIGEMAQRLYPYLEIGMPVGIPSSITLSNGITHPILAHGIRDGVYDEFVEAYDVNANLHYRYATAQAGHLTVAYYKHDDLK